MNRLSSLDIARGLAIFLMIFIEASDYTAQYTSFFYKDIHVCMLIVIGPLLFMVSGASLYFWFRHISKKPNAFLKVLKRTIILLISLWLIYFSIGWNYSWASWELLPALGAATLILWVIHRYLGHLPAHYFLTAGILVFFLTIPIQHYIGIHDFWAQDMKFFSGVEVQIKFIHKWNPVIIPHGLIAVGFYPIFPYFGYVLIGYWIAKLIEKDRKFPLQNLSKNIYIFTLSLTLLGFVLLFINQQFLGNSWWLRYSHFPSRLPTELIYAGTNILIIFLLYFYYDRGKKTLGFLSNIFHSIGQNAIYVYIVGLFSIYLIVKLSGFVLAQDASFTFDYLVTLPDFWGNPNSMRYYRNLVSIPQGFMIGLAINIILILLFSKKRYKPGEKLGEHGRRKIL